MDVVAPRLRTPTVPQPRNATSDTPAARPTPGNGLGFPPMTGAYSAGKKLIDTDWPAVLGLRVRSHATPIRS
jgi:hypothetical protein